MSIEFFCPRWGSEQLGWEAFCKKVKQEGYDGIEYAIASAVTNKELEEIWTIVAKHDLKIIAQHYDTGEADFAKHVDLFSAWLEKIKPYPATRINSQTGKDFFTFDQNKQLIEAAAPYGVVHETHRGKFSFAAHVTKRYLQMLPDLRITLDASHWVNVSESFLDDQPEAMQLAIERTDHIHARVGYPEGPQVADPRMTAWQDAMEKHLHWWDQVAESKKNAGERLTITPEFGPFPYMVHVPATGDPVADQWEVNFFMMELLKKRYKGN